MYTYGSKCATIKLTKVSYNTYSNERNIIEAASQGATNSIKLVANVAVNIIAFISFLGFVNATLRWFGERVGMRPPDYEYLTFQVLCIS